MRLKSGSAGPQPEVAVLRALYRLEPNLCLAFSEWFLDFSTQPPSVLETLQGNPIPHPRWHVFLNHPERGFHHLFAVESPDGEAWPLDMRVVQRIGGDLARQGLTGEEVAKLVEEAQADEKTRQMKKYDDLRRDELEANKSQINEVMKGDNIDQGPSGQQVRDQKIVSYPGMADRSSHHDNIRTTPQERGWEKPDYKEEIANA